MHRDWSHYTRLLVIAFLGLLGFGLFIGHPAWTLIAGLLIYLFWTLRQVKRLHYWLAHPSAMETPPESHGLWGDLFDGLYKLQQKHLQAQDRQRTLINRIQESTNALRDAVIMTDANGVLEWWNRSAEQLLGFRLETDQGQLIHNLVRQPEFKAYFEAKDYSQPLEMPSPAKPHLILQFQINLFGEDDRLITARDVTRLHQLEQMRRDFVSNVSHEMRTPLTVIAGYLETLIDHADDLPPRWQKVFNTMSQQTNRLEVLLKDLILLSKLETGDELNAEDRVDVGPVLESVVQDARTLSGDREHRITLSLDAPTLILGNQNQLRSAFSNIVFNAVKYTPDHGEIQVRWWKDNKGVYLSVTDNGIGLDPIHIPRLTERFYRADPSRHKDTGGTGLGLAIVKHVLLHHDAKLDVKSAPGKGSTFTCCFPPERLLEATAEAVNR
ncbi:phosphate regulon sensor histidine kinase PhoR [Marinobacteraceae bacterium S3BR75-40.1]